MVGYSQTLNPEYITIGGRGYHQHASFFARNLLIHKQILQLDGTIHANRPESITWLPMPQNHACPDLIRVKNLVFRDRFEAAHPLLGFEMPGKLCAGELCSTGCVSQGYKRFGAVEF